MCLNSIHQNQLALELTNIEILRDSMINIPETISDTIKNKYFWKNIRSLLTILDILVASIATFESDSPQLAFFYHWYQQQLISNGIIIF
jgi:hypothetical protein